MFLITKYLSQPKHRKRNVLRVLRQYVVSSDISRFPWFLIYARKKENKVKKKIDGKKTRGFISALFNTRRDT